MGFFITDAIQSAFTPRGTNARQDQENQQKGIADIASGMANSTGANLSDTLSYLKTKNPTIRQGLDSLGRSTTRAGLRDNAIRAGRTARGVANGRSVPLQYQSNPYLTSAYRADMMNKATDLENQGIFESTSPEAQSKALMELLQALSGYQTMASQPFQQAAGMVYGAPQVQVEPGLFSQIAPIIGQGIGSNWGRK
jgi:hypothetical protein